MTITIIHQSNIASSNVLVQLIICGKQGFQVKIYIVFRLKCSLFVRVRACVRACVRSCVLKSVFPCANGYVFCKMAANTPVL